MNRRLYSFDHRPQERISRNCEMDCARTKKVVSANTAFPEAASGAGLVHRHLTTTTPGLIFSRAAAGCVR